MQVKNLETKINMPEKLEKMSTKPQLDSVIIKPINQLVGRGCDIRHLNVYSAYHPILGIMKRWSYRLIGRI